MDVVPGLDDVVGDELGLSVGSVDGDVDGDGLSVGLVDGDGEGLIVVSVGGRDPL